MTGSSLIKGFVNLNIENDENSYWHYKNSVISFSGIPSNVIGGNNSSFILNLDKKSIYGIEEVQLGFSGTASITTLDYNEEPVYLKWEIGEKQKIIRFSTSNNGVISFYLKNPKNISISSVSGITISVIWWKKIFNYL